LGKSVIINGADKILTLEIICRVLEDKSIEFIFNDLTKTDLYNGTMQFMIKTGQFLHDFKNPLICILNEVAELKEQNENLMGMIYEHIEFLISKKIESNININLDDWVAILEKFEYIKQMSEYCQNMIGSYEDFSKGIFKPQAINLSIEKFDLIEMLRFLENMMNFKLSYSNKNIDFKLNLENLSSRSKRSNISNKDSNSNKDSEEFKLIVASDEAKLKRVLINILSNSEKFTTEGEIVLTVTKEIVYDKRYFKFMIEDTGIGMDSNVLQKLFTPFFSNNNTEVNKNGCGLGLIIVKEITEKLGIGIKIFSDVGKGTTSIFYVEDRSFVNLEKMNTFDFESKSNKSYFAHDRTINLKSQNFNTENLIGIKEILDNLDESEIDEVMYNRRISLKKERNLHRISTNNSLNFLKPTYVHHSGIVPESSAIKKILSRKSLDNGNQPNRPGMINIFNSFTTNSSYIVENKNRYTPLTIVNESSFEIKAEVKRNGKNFFYNLNSKNFKQSGKNLNILNRNISNNLIDVISKSKQRLAKQDLNNSDQSSLKNHTSLHKKETFENNFQSDSTTNEIIKPTKDKRVNSKSRFANLPRYNSISSGQSRNIEIYDNQSETSSKEINILIIDNEQSIRSFCKNSIFKIAKSENLNINVEEADDGFTGIAQIFFKLFNSKGVYDLIITDDIMTYLDGSDMVNILTNLNSSKVSRYKIEENILQKILICSSDSQHVKYKIKDDNNIRVCEKPLNQEFLKKVIDNII
jgi:signal transduction histidine kinase